MRQDLISMVRPAAATKPRTGPALKALADRIRSWYAEGSDIAGRHARAAIKAEGYYHGDGQLSAEERQTLADRDQPDIVFNRVGPSIDVVLGTERRSRTQPEFLPRGANDEEKARIITAISRGIEDENGSKYECSDVFQDGVLVGIGWLYQGRNHILTGPKLCEYFVPWEEMVFDNNAKRIDLQDRRWLIRHRWQRLEEVLSWMPQHRKSLLAAVGATGLVDRRVILSMTADGTEETDPDYGYTMYRENLGDWPATEWVSINNPLDPMVNVGECWYKEFVNGMAVEDPNTGERTEFSADNPTEDQVLALLNGANLVRGTVERMRVALFAGPYILSDSPSPYNHNSDPYTAFVCYRNRRTKKIYGIPERMFDPQDVVNRAFSKLYHTMATRQIWVEKGAAENMDDLADQATNPDGVIELNPGGLTKYKIESGGDRIRQYESLMAMANTLLGENTGTNDEMMGRESNARTGVAIDKRIERGSTILGPVFDNYYRFKWHAAKKRLALIKQFIDAPTAVRMTDEMGSVKYVTANEVAADGRILNAISNAQLDTIINETPERASLRQAMAMSMMEMAKGLPEDMARVVVPLTVEMADVPNKQEWVRRLNMLAMPQMPPVVGPNGEIPSQLAA